MKKYHHRPTLGVRSGKSRWTPYVEEMNSQEPVRRNDSDMKHAMLPRKADVLERAKKRMLGTDFSLLYLASKLRRMSGGSRSAGYSDRYEARPSVSMAVRDRPWQAFAIAYRIAQLVKRLVGRPRQDAIVKGLNR